MKKSTVSKLVGHKCLPIDLVWPNREVIDFAVRMGDAVAVMRWHRFLPSPVNDEQRELLQIIEGAYKTIFD